ncbi:carbohydrate ABC transporter permease [Candidatus Cetobacterium colombiensis]|uniref:Sugar ABC transporter permease n=1 Tax=Candidatus Cetobacterium colombiensis TaxID=3073100 RepID=A0ABU4W993_9FUSO|nr:sugar ABC transporter permease [Candidatus Cetobacterium colombiensis]MDX8336102.1 sugar ABC transporter permease [Candidatus Cetobacterium colombiensis]
MKKEQKLTGILFSIPSLIILITFYIYPLIKTFIYSVSFTDAKGQIVGFAGIENFYELLTDSTFYESILVTLKFSFITVFFSMAISLFLAIICNEKLKGIKLFRVLFSSSMGVSVSASSSIVLFLFHPSVGLVNDILKIFGILPINWFTSSTYAIWAVAFTTIWMNIGFGFLVLTAGLQNISQEIDESCEIDGVNYFTKLFKVTIPLLSPSLFYLLITTTLKAFQSFGQVDMLTGGGPANSTNLIVYSIYKTAFSNYRFDYASAQGLFLLLLITIIMVVKFKLERKVHYQ